MQDQPTLYLLGGPNGAGKTTFAKEYLPNEVNCLRFYNSDEIAAGLSPLDPASAQYQAGKILLKNLSSSIAARETFARSPLLKNPGNASKTGLPKVATLSRKRLSSVASLESKPTSSTPTSNYAMRATFGMPQPIPSNLLGNRLQLTYLLS